MDLGKISEIITGLSGIIESLAEIPKASDNSGYKTLRNTGLDNGFVASYDLSLEDLNHKLKTFVSSLESIKEEMNALDSGIEEEAPEEINEEEEDGKQKDGYIEDPNKQMETEKEQFAVDGKYENVGDVEIPNSKEPLIDNSVEQFEYYKNLSMINLINIVSSLNEFARINGKTVEEILNDESYSDKLKEFLLSNPYISDDLKELIMNSDSAITQEVIKEILNGSQKDIIGLDKDTLLMVKVMLENLANSNNVNIEELLTNNENSNMIKEYLKGFGAVTDLLKPLKEQEMIEQMIKVYDGDSIENINPSAVTIIRNYIECLSYNDNISADEIFESASFIDDIEKLGKFSTFMYNLSNYSDSSVNSFLKNLFIGD